MTLTHCAHYQQSLRRLPSRFFELPQMSVTQMSDIATPRPSQVIQTEDYCHTRHHPH
jgi:hypothetical protein